MRTYFLDSQQSKVFWSGKDDRMTNCGELSLKGGKFFVHSGKILDGYITIDMASMSIADDSELSIADRLELVDTLKSRAFVDTEEHPEAVYRIRGTESDAFETIIRGTLMLKGKEFVLDFPSYVLINNRTISARSSLRQKVLDPVVESLTPPGDKAGPFHSLEVSFLILAHLQHELVSVY